MSLYFPDLGSELKRLADIRDAAVKEKNQLSDAELRELLQQSNNTAADAVVVGEERLSKAEKQKQKAARKELKKQLKSKK